MENGIIHVQPKYNYPDNLGYYYLNLSEEEKKSLLNKPFEEKVAYLKQVKARKEKELAEPTPASNILEVQEPEKEIKETSTSPSESTSEKKTVTIQEPAESSSESSSSNQTRKITL
jgi:hypothetical protein